MEQPKIFEQLVAIKKEHNYDTFRPLMSLETIACGENLEEILPKLTGLRKQIDEYKIYLMRHRSELYEEISAYLTSKGLPAWEYTVKKMTPTTPKYLNDINLNLTEKYRYNDYREIQEISLMEKYIKLTLEKRAQSEHETKAKEAESNRYSAIHTTAKKYLTPEELKTAIALGATPEQLEGLIKERYTQSRMGETIGISCCQECGEYEIGEHRCSCGNRRISATAEGYYSEGEYKLYIETEAY